MNAKNAKKDDQTVLTEILDLVEEGGHENKLAKDPQNLKIQEKFDAAFDDLEFGTGDIDFKESTKPEAAHLKDVSDDSPSISFDLDTEKTGATLSNPVADTGMEFDLSDSGLDLGNEVSEFDEATRKTEMFSAKDLDFGNIDEPIKEVEDSVLEDLKANVEEDQSSYLSMGTSSGDLISSNESKEIIEATINDIVRPKINEGTAEIDLAQMANDSTASAGLDPDLFQERTADKTDDSINIDFSDVQNFSNPAPYKKEHQSDDDLISKAVVTESLEKHPNIENEISPESFHEEKRKPIEETFNYNAEISNDMIRLQSTIRQLREEREVLVLNQKSLKSNLQELEQDNLTLKAALDESRIEVSILRKRHLTEIEDYKYRLSMSEEKRHLAEEKVRSLEKVKEKIEHKTRIDYNQIRQREKELESKLELMAMDVDSQVHSRDQKILELRRKIDSLEFNMENASIKEQKSNEDKRRLEEKLNKMMKTLRQSIKNLEDDIEMSTDEVLRADKDK